MYHACAGICLGISLVRVGGSALRHVPDDVRVAGVGDGHPADAEVLAAGGAQLDVVAVVVVHAGLGEHGVVLDLRFPKSGRVAGNDNELSFSQAKLLQGLLVSQHVFAGFHHQRELGVDRLQRLLLLLLDNHGYTLLGTTAGASSSDRR